MIDIRCDLNNSLLSSFCSTESPGLRNYSIFEFIDVDLESPADPLDDVRSSRAAAGTSSQSKSNVDRKTIKDCCTPRFSRIQKPKRQMSEAVQKNVERVPVQTRGFDPCGETIETPKNAFEPAEPGLEDKIPSLPLFLVDQIATRVCQTVNERLDSLEKRMNCFDPPKQTVCEKPKKQRPCKSTKEEFIPISCPLKIPKTSKKYRKICDDM
ncbi:unnamed protein product [Notodromas monacha]|uniref:Uncharacterized protein n=1 Tax=Notodromas monacha TaxID=399045 RepID=A0A7R9BWY3_9CRUS|nr:unnamed protein product [Notodromas monacha]CAG0923307.1 unnamed protein product [Notodromas monacha]